MKVFQYVTYMTETHDRDGRLDAPGLIIDSDTVLADDINQVHIIAAQNIPKNYISDKSEFARVKVLVRPFL